MPISQVKLDFSTLPKVEYAHTFMCLSKDLEERLAPLKKVSARLHNSLRFSYMSRFKEAKDLYCKEDNVQNMREGLMRAALVEFASIEDILSIDLYEIGLKHKPIKIRETNRPHLHLFKELRNHEIHLSPSKLTPFIKKIVLGNLKEIDKDTEHNCTFWKLDGVTIESFSSLKNAKSYSGEQISKMIHWFNINQKEWGVHELFLITVEDYCRIILNLLTKTERGE